MARKNRSEEKRRQILDAYVDCVVKHGLERTSFAEIADELGMDRSSMYHYFSSKEELVSQWVEYIGQFYIDRMEEAMASLPERNRGRELVRMMFSNFHQPVYSLVIDEISVLANRDKNVRELIAKFYNRIEIEILNVLDGAYPDTTLSQRREVASVILQLVEGSTVLESLGCNDYHARFAEEAALHLLLRLELPAQQEVALPPPGRKRR
ncbi:TetR/AcrR family transcriptional regulator [Kineobactrum sediminis]|uniref:TetR/AcrR family transcriptional regulator n=1 Tax=Kineobactrum sediminis TaxID=1905677 RepID=UPI0013903653|nr:TetR/AcrR family transcriptional regulator [Kineobactrum sediminis]